MTDMEVAALATDAAATADEAVARRKPGAKRNPAITDMVMHRKEKNRQAQKALRERRSQQALDTQMELRALRGEVTALSHERGQLLHEHRQLQSLLALAFSSWLPEANLGKAPMPLNNPNSYDAVMIAAKALAELQAGGVAQQTAAHPPSSMPRPAEVHADVSGHPLHPQTAHPLPSTPGTPTTSAAIPGAISSSSSLDMPPAPASPANPLPATPGEPSPFPSPPRRTASVESLQSVQDTEVKWSSPSVVLKERLGKLGPRAHLPAVCEELVHRAVCRGNPWEEADWHIPADLFERSIAMQLF
ncbi:uncharacterized protein EV422DRAFT_614594 [Fimicolochytrium jonesii]|uniref:uncharacterized protein n=1 Tax=Fimicolochytrium jonesii TaxID=1396493 RepID=UPI0022FDD1FE|nr:uncharacterized protein EV422DRAFT_614594 [Fimicolochytrium jonesii]KAI8822175.1 hypothetical protein EV422DRAFT_614594 [Fimicolochytrium jonesii]